MQGTVRARAGRQDGVARRSAAPLRALACVQDATAVRSAGPMHPGLGCAACCTSGARGRVAAGGPWSGPPKSGAQTMCSAERQTPVARPALSASHVGHLVRAPGRAARRTRQARGQLSRPRACLCSLSSCRRQSGGAASWLWLWNNLDVSFQLCRGGGRVSARAAAGRCGHFSSPPPPPPPWLLRPGRPKPGAGGGPRAGAGRLRRARVPLTCARVPLTCARARRGPSWVRPSWWAPS
jgi:hypothetical protein